MKNILLLTILFFLCLNVQGQRGLEAGALIQPQVYGQYYNPSLPDRAVKIPYSFAIGINVGYNFSDNFGFRTGFLYSPEGEKYNITSTDPETAFELNLDNIQLPLYLKLNTSTQNKISFLILGGPHISFLNDATLTVNSDDPINVLGDFKRLNFGASLALGIQVNLDQGGNINFLWRTAASIDPIQSSDFIQSRTISTGLQLAYHYFINL